MRLLTPEGAAPGTWGTGTVEAIDLRGGVSLPRGPAVRREVLLDGCWTPVTVEFVEPSPHGRDASLAAPPDPGDRVFYAYRGWTLSGRLAATGVSVLHFAWRAAAVLRLDQARGRDALAVKMTVPAVCLAGPEDALAALRQLVLNSR